jgi:hypothetical protein
MFRHPKFDPTADSKLNSEPRCSTRADIRASCDDRNDNNHHDCIEQVPSGKIFIVCCHLDLLLRLVPCRVRDFAIMTEERDTNNGRGRKI